MFATSCWKWKRERWFLIVFVVGALGLVLTLEAIPQGIDGDGDEPQLAERSTEIELPPRGNGMGHGDYCAIPGHGVYFRGRDLGNRVTSWPAFARWCEARGCQLGWSE